MARKNYSQTDELRRAPSGPIAVLDSDDILNESAVSGATVSDALDALAAAINPATWAQTLTAGNTSGTSNPFINPGQYLGFGTNPTLVVAGQIRADGAFAIVGNGSVQLNSTVSTAALVGATAASVQGGTTLALTALGTTVSISAATNINLTSGAGNFVSIPSGFLRFTAQAASTPAMSAGLGLFWVATGTPTLPKFTNSADTDFTLATVPVPNADLAVMPDGTAKGRARGAGSGVPIDLTQAQLNAVGAASMQSQIGWSPATGTQSNVLTLLAAGHTPGIYVISYVTVIRTVGVGTNLGATLTWNSPTFGAESKNMFTASWAVTGTVATNVGSSVQARTFSIMSDGTAAITLQWNAGVVTGPPVADLYAGAQLTAMT